MTDFVWTYESPDGDTTSWGPGEDLWVSKVDGLDGFDDVRSSTVDIPRGHGAVPGQHFLSAREPVFTLGAVSDSMTSVREPFLKALKVQTDAEGTLTWERPGETRRLMYCRPVSVVWPSENLRSVSPKVAFEAADPRMYAAAGKTVTLQPYTAGGGLDFDVDYAKEFTVTGTEKPANNEGNTGSPVVVRFYGPTSGTCTAVRLLNITAGVTLEVSTDIVSGQILTVDMRAFVAATGARVVDLSGSNRYGSWSQTREALTIEPGDDNVLRFEADGTTTGMRCRVDWADAWIS